MMLIKNLLVAAVLGTIVAAMASFAEEPTPMKPMNGEIEKGSLAWVYSADTLYACSHHPSMVTNMEHRTCTAAGCSMEMIAMSKEAVEAFRETKPVGCAHCSLAVAGSTEATECPFCKMALMKAEKGEEHGHEHKVMSADE
ncbi:hypothetical protein KQI63_06675 [bacterium]|nr:hypothetical protein [bacterium]